jgi:circadian clock protein KaiB
MTQRLTLYITGRALSSQRAVENLRRIMDQKNSGPYEISIVDVLEHPEEAESHCILATPTLIRESPPPARRILGDLSDTQKVLLGLGLNALNSAPMTKASQ